MPPVPAEQTAQVPGQESAPVGVPAPEGVVVEQGLGQPEDPFAEAREAMADSSPDNFLAQFLEGEGMLPAEPAPQPAPGSVPPVQPPGNGIAAPVGGPQAAPGAVVPPNGQLPPVDPNHLAQLLGQAAPGQVPGFVPQPPVPPPVQQAPAPQPSAAAPASQAPAWQPFDRAFEIPANIQAGLDHDDPRVRSEAMGATIAAAGNATAQRVIEYVKSQLLPEFATSTVTTVQRNTMQERLMGDIFEGRPQLRAIAPHIIDNAIKIVVADATARGIPNYSKEIGQRIGQLALTAAQQLAGGGVPQAFPQPGFMPQQPMPPQFSQPAQPQLVEPPQQGQDGNWYGKLQTGQWVMVQPPAGTAPQQQQQPPIPWMSGQSAGGFGMPPAPAVTPESELASFMQNGW